MGHKKLAIHFAARRSLHLGKTHSGGSPSVLQGSNPPRSWGWGGGWNPFPQDAFPCEGVPAPPAAKGGAGEGDRERPGLRLPPGEGPQRRLHRQRHPRLRRERRLPGPRWEGARDEADRPGGGGRVGGITVSHTLIRKNPLVTTSHPNSIWGWGWGSRCTIFFWGRESEISRWGFLPRILGLPQL